MGGAEDRIQSGLRHAEWVILMLLRCQLGSVLSNLLQFLRCSNSEVSEIDKETLNEMAYFIERFFLVDLTPRDGPFDF